MRKSKAWIPRARIKENLCGVRNRRMNIDKDRRCEDFLDKSTKVGADLFRTSD